ncbi:MAG: hypothetical protein K2O39_04295 [Clostridiales bacterium]|nr:hypothetical protein [Clostridiales bacterium]
MEVLQTIKELFDPTFERVGDSDLKYALKRELLFNLYCFACAVYPEYAAKPCNTLFEYGICFLIEPERHPDYAKDKPEFVHTAASSDVLAVGGRWYERKGKYFIKYDYGSPLFDKLVLNGVIPPDDREPIDSLSLYAAVYCVCNLFKDLRALWYTYYFYLDATNEPVDEEYDEKLFAMLHEEKIYKEACEVEGSMLIGDEAELVGADKLLNWYKPFMDLRRNYIFEVFEKRMAKGDIDFVCEYSTALLNCYPESTNLMNWNAAARTEQVVKSRDVNALKALVEDLREYSKYTDSPVIKKYLQLAELMKKNIDANGGK